MQTPKGVLQSKINGLPSYVEFKVGVFCVVKVVVFLVG